MDLVTMRRQLTNRAILENPLEITLTRVERVKSDSGGFDDIEIAKDPQTFRLFISSRTATRDINQVGGQMQVRIMEMLCPWDADVQRGDTFVFDERGYRIHEITSPRLRGETVSHQCEIEEIT